MSQITSNPGKYKSKYGDAQVKKSVHGVKTKHMQGNTTQQHLC